MRGDRLSPLALSTVIPGLAATVLFVVVGCTIERADVRTPSGEPPESDTARVQTVLDRLADAFDSRDSIRLDTLLAGDLTVFVQGRAERGRSVFREDRLTDGLGAVGPRRLSLSDVSIEIAGGELALVTCRYAVRSVGEVGTLVEEGMATLILKRSAAGWQLTHMHVSPALPAAPRKEGSGESGPR